MCYAWGVHAYPSSSYLAWGINTEVLMGALEVRTTEGFREDVSSVVCGTDMEDFEFI